MTRIFLGLDVSHSRISLQDLWHSPSTWFDPYHTDGKFNTTCIFLQARQRCCSRLSVMLVTPVSRAVKCLQRKPTEFLEMVAGFLCNCSLAFRGSLSQRVTKSFSMENSKQCLSFPGRASFENRPKKENSGGRY